MNRAQALAALAAITVDRADVHGTRLGRGFFLADAIHALGNFDRAVRTISALTRAGRVRCTAVQIGGTFHDLYATV